MLGMQMPHEGKLLTECRVKIRGLPKKFRDR
jgi:hypothetical protein